MSDDTESMFGDFETPAGPPPKPAHWDPPDHERTYYRHKQTGDLGYLVVREGQDKIRLDRPNEEVIRRFQGDDWIPELEHRPMTRAQAAQVAYEADRKLCGFLGLFDRSRKEWQLLHEDQRIHWVDNGPAGPPIRGDVFRAVMGALERVVQ